MGAANAKDAQMWWIRERCGSKVAAKAKTMHLYQRYAITNLDSAGINPSLHPT